MPVGARMQAHLSGDATTLCRCWEIVRRDGVRLGFTDHDETLAWAGRTFRASDGLSARALEQTTGLAVDNSEALGILSDAGVREEDILAGRYDGAGVTSWLVNWADPAIRMLQFRGELGEIERAGGAFKVELRGLTESLNQPQGRVYQSSCAAVLGDASCGLDLDDPLYSIDLIVGAVTAGKQFTFENLTGFEDRWFEKGRLRVLSGPAAGELGVVKNDRGSDGARTIELWESLRGGIAAGYRVRLEAGCDKRAATCRSKFDNMVNFRGFPTLPGEDWLMAYPTSRNAKGDGDD